jgi:hypothetical protein
MIQKCFDSWREKMPDYEIKRWSLENFDINSVPLTKEAYEQKKYAFAADYIRCYALYNEGGIYLDSDVILHKSIHSLLKGAEYVTSVEFKPTGHNVYNQQVDKAGHRKTGVDTVYGIGLQAAFMASVPHHPLMKDCLDTYNGLTLTKILEKYLLAPIVQVKEAEKYGFVYKNEQQRLDHGILIYPTKVIGQWKKETSGRYATHLCEGSWVKKSLRVRMIQIANNIGIYKLYMGLKDKLGLVKID